MNKLFTLCFSFFLILTLTSCNISDEDLSKTTINQAKIAFEEKPKKPNKETKLFSYYVPEKFEIKETNKYNVILEQGKQSYILFVNLKEKVNSQVSYEALSKQYKNPLILKTFENEEKFGYLFVDEVEKNQYEITVGIGGTKLTTETNKSDIEEDAQNMMEIVNSVKK
ncbi:hypothetical protein JOC75_004173 [Metabacillus crassostreae]|uniref:hypothetical protein n=1 Tax=Metabacillus crassostreae TaxID=929098 RepID=UPI001957CDC9|nr:hypothetical protein [Metabacillus crassostreae]MBM7606143.1 hypothetical protein [Metabacillus crassostreae]